jgi:hypothetical protein
MSMDVEHLGPGPDLEAIDFSKLDMGNSLEEAPPVDEKPAEEAPPVDEKPAEEAPPVDEKPAEEKPAEEKPRDKEGKFAKKEREHPDHIPKARLNEEIDKTKAEREAREVAERKAVELERQLRAREREAEEATQRSAQVQALDKQLDALEAQRDQLLLDGEKEKAGEMSRQIREMSRQVARLEAQEESTAIVSATLENERLMASIARLEAQHPVLNPRSETYDKDLVDVILPLQSKLVQDGVPPSLALETAVGKVMARLQSPKAPEPEKEGLAQVQVPAKDDERKQEQVKKAVDAQNRQPASTQAVGLDSDKAGDKALPDVSRMTAEEYAALPETTRARMRGDLL